MARIRPREEEGSLDLLLDTVCNAFGGIIFIVILLSIIPAGGRPKSDPVAADANPASAALVAELDRLQAELSHSERIIELQKRTSNAFHVETSQEELALKQELTQKVERLRDDLAAKSKSDEKLDQEIAAKNADAKSLDGIKGRLESGLLKGQAERKQGEVRVTRLPRLRGVAKSNVFLVLYEGRVYLPKSPGEQSIHLFDNTDDFEVTNLTDGRRYVPRPGRGVPLSDWMKDDAGGKRLLRSSSRELYVINLCIYPDSVQHFSAVRNFFTEREYDYNWSPLSAGEPLVLVRSRGGSTAQ